MKNGNGWARTLSYTLLCVFLGGPAFAENPFQGNPAAAAPTEPSDFQEQDFGEPTDNFGLGQQGAPGQTAPPTPPSTASAPPSAPSVPPRATPPSQVTRAARPVPTPAADPAASASKKSATGAKAPPKLAEYLELDATVKGLEVKNFDLPDKDIKDVVTLISKWTGKNFILDSKVRGKITIIGPSQVTLQEAYHAFLSALEANGLTTVQSGKFIRIIESAEARRAPVETYAGDYAPTTDQFITRIFQLKYINADEVQREFRDLTTRQGKLFAYEPTNSIIITDTGSNIRRIEGILSTLDVKSFETTLHVLKIKNSSAKVISDMLGEIYGDDKGARGGSGPRTFRRSALERTRGGGIISKIIPDEATNSLVVLANGAGFIMLQQLVGKLDVKVTDSGRIHVYYCEYAKAEDLASTLSSLASGGSAKSTRKTTGSTGPAGSPSVGAPAGGGTSGGPVTAELEGGVKITSDAATNSLVITANSSDYQTLKRVIRKLDIPRLQVFVETAILEVTLGDSDNVGVNVAAGVPVRGFGGGFIGDATALTSVLGGGLPPAGATIPFFAGPSFAAKIGGADVTVNSLMGVVNLLASNAQTSVLSTPQIIALDNEKAEFKVLDETPVQTNFTALAAGSQTLSGSATGSIERQKTGIEIKLTPHVNAASRTIRLEIEQKVDNIKQSADIPEALKKVQVGTTSRVTNTQVVVKDRNFVMLGGLMSDKVDDTTTKVPLLGDIPVLGWLFKSRTHKTVKTNLIILLQPRIIGTSMDAADQIDTSLKTRKDFIDENFGGETPQDEGVRRIQRKIREQRANARDEQPFDYSNTLNDEEDRTSTTPMKVIPRPQESLLDTPAPKEARQELNLSNKVESPLDTPKPGTEVPASDALLLPSTEVPLDSDIPASDGGGISN